jgi:hypothetical protein
LQVAEAVAEALFNMVLEAVALVVIAHLLLEKVQAVEQVLKAHFQSALALITL